MLRHAKKLLLCVTPVAAALLVPLHTEPGGVRVQEACADDMCIPAVGWICLQDPLPPLYNYCHADGEYVCIIRD